MQNYYFEFDWCIKHQIYGKGIGWKVMISDNTKPWAWMRHIGIFHSGQKLNMTLKVSWNDRILPISISNLHTRNLKPLLIFCYCCHYLWWGVKPTVSHQFLEHILFTANNVLFIIKGYALKSCVPNHEHLRDILKFIDDEIRRVLERKPNSLFEPCPKTCHGVPVVLTFHP